uniref:Protein FAR1-RELATED SEQUENCE n=1 Tax=Lactuca sativa TaxID=4236 RepID=A0A9R1XGU7_LACSA|nr:hypothetical protein LSAT_V11C500262530 [Lactuca sativa]
MESLSKSDSSRLGFLENADDVKPKLYSKYLSVDDAIHMYKAYAAKAGFDVRKGSTRLNTKSCVLTHRSMMCSREGFPQNVYVDKTDSKKNKAQRNSNIKRKGCPTFAKFRRVGNSEVFELYKFEERHNHDLVTEDYRHFLRSNRVKIGPMKAYRIMQELRGSNNVGGTVVDYKNQSRKVNCFIEKDDAQMVVDKYLNKMKEDPSLTFEVSYGIGNHRKSVTFVVGLLNSETTKSSLWLLKTFLKTFGKQPTVLTDEDATMKIAIERIFPDSHHRLCMWHITQKLPYKVCIFYF